MNEETRAFFAGVASTGITSAVVASTSIVYVEYQAEGDQPVRFTNAEVVAGLQELEGEQE